MNLRSFTRHEANRLPWFDQDIVLYHGTREAHFSNISLGVNLNRCPHMNDFGRGFYTTTSRQQAERWAVELAIEKGDVPAVISYAVARDSLARLDCLFFVRGTTNAFDYWDFVLHCRKARGDHNRAHAGWYDLVVGPVSGSLKKRTIMPGSDQISFHTPAAISVLNQSQSARIL